MMLVCENCGTQYNLDPAKLGASGRSVRCTKCQHVWFAKSLETTTDETQVVPDAVPAPVAEALPPPLTRQLDDSVDVQPQSFPSADLPPIVDYRPAGMGAGQFGAFTFLLLLFATLIPLFLMRTSIVHAFPVFEKLYRTIGFEIVVPGEGVKFSGMNAWIEEGRLHVSAKVSNMSARPIDYPGLDITLSSVYGAVLKEWHFAPEPGKIEPAGTTPVNLHFSDAPADGNTVTIAVSPH